MKRSGIVFGTLVVLLGVVLLAINLGLVDNRIWNFFWPVLLVLLGVWFILRPRMHAGTLTPEQESFPVNTATEAEISLHYGAGRLNVSASTNLNELAGGRFTGGVLSNQSMQGTKAILSLRTPSDRIFEGPWPVGNKGYEWQVGINPRLPIDLRLHTGANEEVLDLSATQVKNLLVETGASQTEIKMPSAAGFTRATVKSGLASVSIHVPEGVSASIKVESGLSGINVNPARFPHVGERYESPDYQAASNKVEIIIESGLGSVDIH